MTQKAIADAMGISESFYCQLEGGKRRLTMDHAMKIANILSKSLDEIFYPRTWRIANTMTIQKKTKQGVISLT